jgi:hypothetical protein
VLQLSAADCSFSCGRPSRDITYANVVNITACFLCARVSLQIFAIPSSQLKVNLVSSRPLTLLASDSAV